MREALKSVARALATLAVSPWLVSFWIRTLLIGRDQALQGSSQRLSLVPGLSGQYLRRAFLARTLTHFDATAVAEFGVLFSHPGARVDERVYIGPHTSIGFAHIERNALLGPRVQVLSGAHQHGTDDPNAPIIDQPFTRTLVRIGQGAWIGAGAIVMADVGADSIVGAGAVVTRPIPPGVVAGGVPARVIRPRNDGPAKAGH